MSQVRIFTGIPLEQGKDRVEILYFYGSHVSIKIHKHQSSPFIGFYLSHGSSTEAEHNYEEGVELDTKTYGEPIRILLDLPQNMTLDKLNQVFEFKLEQYGYVTNNCADAVLSILRDQLQYPSLQNVKSRLATLPQYVARKACELALEQNSEHKAKISEKKPENDQGSIQLLIELVECEKRRLEIERTLIIAHADVFAWNSVILPQKIAQKAIKASRLKDNDKKASLLSNLIVRLARAQEKLQSDSTHKSIQSLFDELRKAQRKLKPNKTRDAYSDAIHTCIKHFPCGLLPGKEQKLKFLLKLQERTQSNSAKFTTLFGKSLPKGIDAINSKLTSKGDLRIADNSTIQEIFADIQDILYEKVHDGKERTQLMKDTYHSWYKQAKEWEQIQVMPQSQSYMNGNRF